jgi:hypothetical protein
MRGGHDHRANIGAVDLLSNAGRDLRVILVDGVRALVRHWPALLALFLLGSVARQGVIWLAVWVSSYSSTVAVLLVPLAPLSTLISLVLMLRVCGESLPAFAAMFDALTTPQRIRSNLSVATQVLIPFLAVYASQGLLKEDTISFLHDVTLDESMSHFLRGHYDRVIIAEGWILVAIVVIALVVRKLIAGYDLVDKGVGWGVLGGYVEALWMVTLAGTLTSKLDEIAVWMQTRKAIAPVMALWDQALAFIENSSFWIKVPLQFLGGILANMGDLVIIPVAWMALGAVVYGTELRAADNPLTHEAMTKRIAKIPNPVRKIAAQVVEPITTPVQDVWKAIRKVATVGVLPMVVFCVVFASTSQLKSVVAWLARLVMGPTDDYLQLAVMPYEALVERAVYLVVTVALLAAAVNTVVVAQTAEQLRAEAEAEQLPDEAVAEPLG